MNQRIIMILQTLGLLTLDKQCSDSMNQILTMQKGIDQATESVKQADIKVEENVVTNDRGGRGFDKWNKTKRRKGQIA